MSDKGRVPLTPLERCSDALKLALELYDEVMRDKMVIENLERYDVARRLSIASDHFLQGRLLLEDALRQAAKVREYTS
jgi:hypothetical protein